MMSKKLFVPLIFLFFMTALPAGAVINATSVEIRGSIANGGNFVWDNSTFSGFFYDIDDNLGVENLRVDGYLDGANRTINKANLSYSTGGQAKYLQVVEKQFAKNADAAMAAGLEQFGNGSMAGIPGAWGAGAYTIMGWQGEKYVAIKKKPYKIAKLLIGYGASPDDKRNLTAGETWAIGGGWNLTVKSINGSAAPKNVTFYLTKDGIKKNDTVRDEGRIYTYVENNISNETDVPMFVTYIGNITDGRAEFKYTWALSTTVTEIKSGDKFGVMTVVAQEPLMLKNVDNTVTLAPDSIINIIGEIKFKVVDNATSLWYYPFVLRTSPGIYEVRGSTAIGSFAWDSSNFAGFFYDLEDNLGMEMLQVSGYLDGTFRTIDKANMTYSSIGQPKWLQVVEKQYSGDAMRAIASGLEQFANGSMAGSPIGGGVGQYTIVGWQGEKYVAIKKRPYKLAKLLIEQGFSAADKKTLAVGETWDIGGGLAFKLNSIDVKAVPRQALFTLSKDGVTKDVKIITAGTYDARPIYTYVEKSLAGESDVPVFVTYVDGIFAGTNTELVQLRYTWALSSNATLINGGDTFGVMSVAQQDPLVLMNSDNTVTLSPGSVIDIMGELKFKVADDPVNLRYYPFITYEILPTSAPFAAPEPLDTLVFEPGTWNLVSVPKTLNDPAIEIALGNLSSDSNNIKWGYNISISDWESPSKVLPLRGYWIYNNASTRVTQKLNYKVMAGPNVPPSMTLKAGWNLIGHTSTKSMPVSSALVSIEGKYSQLLAYSPAEGWKMYIVGNPSLQQFDVLVPGRGYWVFMTQDATYAAVDV